MLTAFAAYLAVHLLAYVVLLRHSARLHTERGIFLYHFVPATMTGLAGLAYAAVGQSAQLRFSGLVLILSIHGIYSLSFLELWSLAQGGYSLFVLADIARAEANGGDPDFSHLERIGETKQRERIAGLANLGLIAGSDSSVRLTRRGAAVASLLHCLLKWIDPETNGGVAA